MGEGRERAENGRGEGGEGEWMGRGEGGVEERRRGSG